MDATKPTGLTIKEFAEQYAQTHILPKPSGQRDWRRAQHYLRPLFPIPMADLMPDMLEQWFHSIPAKTQATWALLLLRRMYRWAIRSRRLGIYFNPAEDVKPYRGHYRQVIINLGEEMDRFLAVLEAQPLRERVYFELAMGISARKMEIGRLQWSQIDLTTGQIRLWQTKTQRHKTLQIPPVPLELLKELAQSRCCDHVFCRAVHAHWSNTNIQHAWIRIRNAANLRHVHIHDLRRSRLSHIYKATKDIKLCQQLAGHTDPTMTWRYIVAEVTEEANAANAAMDAFIRKSRKPTDASSRNGAGTSEHPGLVAP
jgi:integrase